MPPLLVYDNTCYYCSRFAMIASKLSRGWIRLVGHYSKEGEYINSILGLDARDMFWIINDDMAYGGRYALLPLIRSIIIGFLRSSNGYKHDIMLECNDNCSIARRVFMLLNNGRKVKLSKPLHVSSL